jgi:hypothetical protein
MYIHNLDYLMQAVQRQLYGNAMAVQRTAFDLRS